MAIARSSGDIWRFLAQAARPFREGLLASGRSRLSEVRFLCVHQSVQLLEPYRVGLPAEGDVDSVTYLVQGQRHAAVLALGADDHSVRRWIERPRYLVPGLAARPAARGYAAKVVQDVGDRTVDDIDAPLGVAGEVSKEFVVKTVREAF
jgi:hypothetical protein